MEIENKHMSLTSYYNRSPPRPSPASVAYSDDDAASAAKPPLPDDDDDDDSSCTEKPSELGDSDSEVRLLLNIHTLASPM